MRTKVKYVTTICLCVLLLFIFIVQLNNDSLYFCSQQNGSSVKVTIERGRGIKTLKKEDQVTEMIRFKDKADQSEISMEPPEGRPEMGGQPSVFRIEFIRSDGVCETYVLAEDRICQIIVEPQPYTMADEQLNPWYEAPDGFYEFVHELYQ